MSEKLTETQFTVELEQQIHSFVELAIKYQEELTVKNFIEHLQEKYNGK